MAIRPLRVCLVAALWASAAAGANPTSEAKRQASVLFEEGLRHAEHAEYDAAARSFLRADELSPDAGALMNAMAAARRANADLLLVDAAQRALDRGDAEVATMAREALLYAERHLARLERGCDPLPCKMAVDGLPAPTGTRYVLPGDHVVTATRDGAADATERVSAIAGTQHRVSLSLRATAGPLASAAPAASAIPPPSDPPAPVSSGRPISPAVFYTAAAVSIVLVGVTTWSGIATLSSKPDVSAAYTQNDKDQFHSNIRRTNVLLATTAIVGVATAAMGLVLVDWGTRGAGSVGVSVTPSGGMLVLRGAL